MPLVLIVDASSDGRAALADFVRKRGFAAVSVTDFAAALAAMHVLDVDVLVSDVQLAQAQADHIPQGLSVIIYTSSPSDGLSHQPGRLFRKPAQLEHLLAAISASCC